MSNDAAFALTEAALDVMMPFHLRIDGQGKVGSAGRTLQRIFGGRLARGSAFAEAFAVLSPAGLDTASFHKAEGQRLVLAAMHDRELNLRGTLVRDSSGEGWLLNLSPGAQLARLVTELGLTSRDFAHADSAIEMLFLVETQASLLSESRLLNTRLTAAKEAAVKLSETDSLTGIPNRRALTEKLRALADANRTGVHFTLALLDLNGFKEFNDTHGHAFGDGLLVELAQVLQSGLGEGDFVARIGGDEFVLIYDGPCETRQIERKFDDIQERISQIARVRERGISVGMNFGATSSEHYTRIDPDRMLLDADLALQDARNCSEQSAKWFRPALRHRHEELRGQARAISQAVVQGAFEPWFQPQVDLASGHIIGMETLIRWRHPDRGMLSPGDFLPAAQDAGLLNHIDEMVLDRALGHMRAWIDEGLDLPCISLNITASRIAEARFVEKLLWALDHWSLETSRVRLEIVESVLLDRASPAQVGRINALARAGFRLELDDFGTNYSSISNLRRFDISTLKIDRAFVTGIDGDAELQKITGAIVSLASRLGITPLAEGVETVRERNMLLGLGCTVMQGFLIAKPMSASETVAWCRNFMANREAAPSMAGLA